MKLGAMLDAFEERLRTILDEYFPDDDAEITIDEEKDAAPKKYKRRDMSCIAPKCKTVSKGPRFHYLCEKHLDVPVKQMKEWQEKRRAERSAT